MAFLLISGHFRLRRFPVRFLSLLPVACALPVLRFLPAAVVCLSSRFGIRRSSSVPCSPASAFRPVGSSPAYLVLAASLCGFQCASVPISSYTRHAWLAFPISGDFGPKSVKLGEEYTWDVALSYRCDYFRGRTYTSYVLASGVCVLARARRLSDSRDSSRALIWVWGIRVLYVLSTLSTRIPHTDMSVRATTRSLPCASATDGLLGGFARGVSMSIGCRSNRASFGPFCASRTRWQKMVN